MNKGIGFEDDLDADGEIEVEIDYEV